MNKAARVSLLLSILSISVAVAWNFTPPTSGRGNSKVAPAKTAPGANVHPKAAIEPYLAASLMVQSQATFKTDKDIYLAGEKIVFSGTNWAPDEAVTIVISAGIKNLVTVQAVTDKSGSFTSNGTMPDPRVVFAGEEDKDIDRGLFLATATGASSATKIETEFAVAEADHDGERLLAQEGYWIHRQTYPTNQFNSQWVRTAAEQDARVQRGIPSGRQRDARSMAANILALSPLGFTALGPAPEKMTGCNGCFDYTTTAGRINDIKIDPTTTTNGSIVAYAASVGGGVWKTTNCCSGSTTWTVKTDDPLISTTNIDSLTIDPNNHNTIYAGTGDLNYGSFSMGSQGILKSTDAGENWTVVGASVFGASLPVPVGQFPQYQAVGKVRVDPNNSNKVVAGTKTGLYLSYDGGANWTGPCITNSYPAMRQDITGLELSNMGGGITRIIAAVGVRGFATTVQFNLDQNGANGIYKGTMPASGCPSDFTSIASNANGFVNGATNTNIGSGAIYVNPTTGNQVGRIEIAVAPSNPDYIYAQVQAIKTTGQGSGCGGAAGCQLGVWATTNGGTSWTFMTGSAGASLAECAGSGAGAAGAGTGDYPQNWYDQAVAVDPNNPDRIFVSTYDVWLATRTGTTFYDVTCGYSNVSPKPVHVDQHALAFVPGSSGMLLLGNDGGVHGTLNANAAVPATTRPTWFNMDTGFNTIEFYSGDISGNFATSPFPSANGGAQDNGPSSVLFSGSPTGPMPWQMGLGGDGFYARIDPVGQGPTSAAGTISLTTGGALPGETFVIGSQTFTWQTGVRASAGQVQISTSTTTGGNNIVAAITADLAGTATAVRNGATVIVSAASPGAAGNSIVFTEASTNMTMNGAGTLGATTIGGIPNLRYWQGNNSGGVSRCTANCTSPGASWVSRRGAWTGDQQSFILPFEIFHGDTSNPANDCGAPGATTGCGHLIAGTVRVWETLSGATGTNTWYVNSPANLTKGTLGNRSFINQLAFEPKDQNTVIVGTNDGAVQIGRGLGTGSNQSTWVDVTGGNSVLPNRPILDVAFDPTTTTAPIAYAAVGGFNENTPSQPGHVLRVVCTVNCASFTWTDKSGNLPNIPVDSIVANPNFPMQVFAGTDFGLYYTDDITAVTPVWTRFNAGLPNVMIWDMQIDRGNTTLSLWTRSRGAFAWPLPLGPLAPLPTTLTTAAVTGSFGGTVNLTATLISGGNGVPGKTINFTLNGNSVGSAVTNASGVANLANASLAGINGGLYPTGVGAGFTGDSVYQAATATNSLTVLQPPTITCPASFSVNNDAGLCSAVVNFTGAHAATAIGYPAPTITYSPASGSVFGVGTTNVTATATNSEGTDSCTFAVTVNDTELPVVSTPTTDPSILWPPEHQMVLITVSYNATDNCPNLNCVLTVASNEPINGLGDGDTAPDWQVVNAHRVFLRAERSGKSKGRTYTITTTCTDASNNVVVKTSTVFVPPNQKGAWVVAPTSNTIANVLAPATPGASFAPSQLTMAFVNFDFSSVKPAKAKSASKNENLVNFILGDLEFNALNYDYRELSGARTQFTGAGKVNNEAGFKYVLTVIDGQAPQGGGVDKFRLKIWNEKTGEVVFDNQSGAADDAEPTTAIGTGESISFPK